MSEFPSTSESPYTDANGTVWRWVLAIIFTATAQAAPVTVQWLPVVSSPAVTEYRVYRLSPLTLLTTSTNTSALIDIPDNVQVVVTAFNGVESQPSAPLTIRFPSITPGARRITLQISSDLQTWSDFQVTELPSSFQFSRLKIETP